MKDDVYSIFILAQCWREMSLIYAITLPSAHLTYGD